jgi:hypothetical protein
MQNYYISHPFMSFFSKFPQTSQSFLNNATSTKKPSKALRILDVFLSFRGEDTRASFTSHLHVSLQNSGVIVFKDDHSLPRGNRVSKSLLQAIEDSRISVVIFLKKLSGITVVFERSGENYGVS